MFGKENCMKTKLITLSLLTLALSSMAIATEYKSPEVGFKKHVAPSKEMKTAEFGEHYKVETGVMTDRQIASEEESDREPSSFKAKAKKKKAEMEVKEDPKMDVPKPWLYKADETSLK